MAVYTADYYVRPVNGSDSNAGTSWGEAFATLQKALDVAVAGKVVGCAAEAEEVLTARIDDDTNSGSSTSDLIKFVGLAANGTRDGTRYVINGNSAVNQCLIINGRTFKKFINFQFKNSSAQGVSTTTVASTSVFFENCVANNNSASGFDVGVNGCNLNYYKCQAYSNGLNGFGCVNTTSTSLILTNCSAYLNASHGFKTPLSISIATNCLFYKNTGNGIDGTVSLRVYGCTIDGNAVGILMTTPAGGMVHNCRITNNNTAIAVTTGLVVEDYNYYYVAPTKTKFSVTTGKINSGNNSVDMASDGYVNRAGSNYSLINGATPATGRFVSFVLDPTNTDYSSIGMQPNPDFPAVASVRPPDTVDGVTGTQTALATDADFLALEAGRNTDPTEAKVLATTAYKILGVNKTGSLIAITAPGAVTISTADGISQTAIRVNVTWIANAEHIYIERAASTNGSYSQIADLTSGNYFDDTVTAGQTWYYKARASNTGGYGPYGIVVAGTSRTSNAIEQTLWATFKTKMQADTYLAAYIQKWKFDKAGSILAESKCPVFKSWILDTSEDWKGIPKSKIVRCRIAIHGLVKVKDSVALETEKLKFDEYVKNAIEADMTFAGGVTMAIVGDTILNNLDDSTAEIGITCEILSNRFTAGQR